MNLDELIASLQALRATHGGELQVLVQASEAGEVVTPWVGPVELEYLARAFSGWYFGGHPVASSTPHAIVLIDPRWME